MNKFKKTSTVVALYLSFGLYAQVGIGTDSPSSSSLLELSSNNQGMLFNKIALQATNLAAPLKEHQLGMWVYNTATTGVYPNNVVPGLYYNDGTKWIVITVTESFPRVGDIKSSIYTADHDGWYLLDGRQLTTITSNNAKQNATNLGFTTILPNATDRILKGKSAAEQFATIGGQNSITLTQANLPSHTYNGSTSIAGNHTHTFSTTGNTFWHLVTGTGVTGLRFLQTETRTSNSAGTHSHTISIPSGGTATPISNYPKNMAVIYFIYLGK